MSCTPCCLARSRCTHAPRRPRRFWPTSAAGRFTPTDARQGYAKVEGPWGALTVGRMRTLFSRGATDIDVMYAHRWGVGWPGKLDNNGPSTGMLGFGVLGSGFSSGVIYGTPKQHGLQ